MNALEPGQTSVLTSLDLYDEGGDVSLYMQYSLKNGQEKEESLLYIHWHNTNKVVVLVDIMQIDNHGTILFDTKGYDGLFITE